MKRKRLYKQILMSGVVVPALTVLLGVPIRAQNNTPSDAPPGMSEKDGAFGGASHGPTTFGTGPNSPAKSAISTYPGEVHGVTRYSSGLPMPGAEVAILNADAGIDRTVVSGSDGTFVFKNLKPGEYQLTAKKEGFGLSPITKVDLAAGKILTLDVPLGQSLAGSPVIAGSSGLTGTFDRSPYRVQPASVRVAAAEPAAGESASATETTPTATSQPTTIAASEPTATTPQPTVNATTQPSAGAAEQPVPAAVMDELTAMRKRIDDLEAELKTRLGPDQPVAGTPAATVTAPAVAGPQDAQAPATPKLAPGQYLATGGTATYYAGDQDIPEHPAGWDPFSYADWTWLNANGRQHDSPWSTKYFTPEFRADVNYMDDFNHPKDDTMGGSTESFRSNEWQLEQLSLGGDIRIGHIRGRILTMFGEFATTTPRNDSSLYRGQWDLGDAYRYISEGWGGYHWDNVGHGLNVDAGIFVSYIGLFSYYNFDNWAYQPSYVSSNTPWFFNGLRIQYFPTAKLKIEPWIINGWQSYNRINSKPGLGGQILWRPRPWISLVFNNYGNGTDVFGSPYTERLHTDDSVEIREYNQPDKFLDMAAMSFTGDLGCQTGGGQSCFNDKNGNYKAAFLGYMAYERLQFAHDHYGITLGGGYLNNPGRYLTLLQPINGANAVTGSPYFTENPGDKYHAFDSTATFDYMPSQWLTFRWEMGYRWADVPYWSGKGGITPPGGNTGSPASYVCTNGSASAVSAFAPTGGSGSSFAKDNTGGAVSASCAGQYGSGWSAWQPDLRHSQIVATFAIMTRF